MLLSYLPLVEDTSENENKLLKQLDEQIQEIKNERLEI